MHNQLVAYSSLGSCTVPMIRYPQICNQ